MCTLNITYIPVFNKKVSEYGCAYVKVGALS